MLRFVFGDTSFSPRLSVWRLKLCLVIRFSPPLSIWCLKLFGDTFLSSLLLDLCSMLCLVILFSPPLSIWCLKLCLVILFPLLFFQLKDAQTQSCVGWYFLLFWFDAQAKSCVWWSFSLFCSFSLILKVMFGDTFLSSLCLMLKVVSGDTFSSSGLLLTLKLVKVVSGDTFSSSARSVWCSELCLVILFPLLLVYFDAQSCVWWYFSLFSSFCLLGSECERSLAWGSRPSLVESSWNEINCEASFLHFNFILF